MPGRVTIGLYNSYDPVRFHESHRRVLARAGPLALAFDCNLATFGFPFDSKLTTPTEIAEWVSTTTSIGESGRYLVELAKKGRYSRFDFPKKGFPPQLGVPIITTSKPHPERRTTMGAIRSLLSSGQSVLLIFGLGPHGLPKEVFRISQLHVDVTDRGMSLETCTALGSVVGALLGK